MATIKIYDPVDSETSIEFSNSGLEEQNVMQLRIEFSDESDFKYFNLSKIEAKELIAYLKKEFKI